jgi:hypothetical protein
MLPEGLHDSEIDRVEYDRCQATVRFTLQVHQRSGYRSAEVIFKGALYFTLNAPLELLNDQLHILSYETHLLTDSGSRASLPPGTQLFRFCTQYRVLEVAAADVRFQWQEDLGPARTLTSKG